MKVFPRLTALDLAFAWLLLVCGGLIVFFTSGHTHVGWTFLVVAAVILVAGVGDA